MLHFKSTRFFLHPYKTSEEIVNSCIVVSLLGLPQIMTRRFIINYGNLAFGLGLFPISSYNLNTHTHQSTLCHMTFCLSSILFIQFTPCLGGIFCLSRCISLSSSLCPEVPPNLSCLTIGCSGFC